MPGAQSVAHEHPPLRGEVVYHPGDRPQIPLELFDFVSLVMDRLFLLPGTRVRFGLNSILMLVPILGDVIPTMVSLGILAAGLSNYQVPRVVAARMVVNSLLDAALGWIPIVGDLFDLFFKADTRNVRLLREYAGRGERRPTWKHWVFLAATLSGVVVCLVLLGFGVVAFVGWAVRMIRSA